MKTSKILYQLTLSAGIIFLLLGGVMELFSVEDSGWFFNKQGELLTGTLNGLGTICVGLVLLFFACSFRRTYRKNRDLRATQYSVEKNEEMLSKKYNIHKIRRWNRK